MAASISLTKANVSHVSKLTFSGKLLKVNKPIIASNLIEYFPLPLSQYFQEADEKKFAQRFLEKYMPYE